ncbi:MAG: GAF domain-containing protein [Deltaproteobacteria bacterium]|nr:GAF domain-containing protein [Deltaproteobacteria bacterium]MBN2674086.1 GAF domain-containing protein [Deltaproteobacteria bacterium]
MITPQTICLATSDSKLEQKVKEGLSQAECSLVTINNVEETAEAVDLGLCRIFLIDTQLGMDKVLSLCEALRENDSRQVGIIAIIDGYSEVVGELLNASVDDVLVSPFTVFSLLARVGAQAKRISTADQLAFKVRDSWMLIEITSKLVGTGDLLDSLYDMISILSAELNADRGSVVLVRPEGDLGLVIASSDDAEIQDLIINLDSYPEIKNVVHSAKPLIVQDVSDSQVLQGVLPTLKSVRVQSVALFPIVEEDNVLGVIFLRYADKRDAFHQRELVFCQTVANATAIALRNHEITESLHKKDQQIRAVQSEAQNRLAALQPYEDFFNGAVDGMVVLSDSGVVVFINPEGAAILGHSVAEIKGVPFYNVLPNNQYARFESLVEQSERGRRISIDLEIFADGDQGKVHKIVSTSAALLGTEGMTLLTMRDVTEERMMAKQLIEAQEQLIKSEKQAAIMEVAGAAAHELNQPLTSVLTSVAMFKRVLNDSEGHTTRLLDAMEQEVDRMTSIVRKLSKLTEYTTKDYVGQSKIIDLERSSGADAGNEDT